MKALSLCQNMYINTKNIATNPIFVHVGTITGKLEHKLVEQFPTCHIYSCEPQDSCFKSLVQRTTDIKDHITYINAAVTTKNTPTVQLFGEGSCGSTYKQISSKSTTTVNNITLEQLITQYNIPMIDCIFYNAEGSEMEFLPYLV